MEACHGVIVDPSQHIAEIGLGIEPCEFRGLDDGHGVGDGFAAGVGIGEQIILAVMQISA